MKNKQLIWLDEHEASKVAMLKISAQERIEAQKYLTQIGDTQHLSAEILECLTDKLIVNDYSYRIKYIPDNLLGILSTYPQDFQDALIFALGNCSGEHPRKTNVLNAAWLLLSNVFGAFAVAKEPGKAWLSLFLAQDLHPPAFYYQAIKNSFIVALAKTSVSRKQWISFLTNFAYECYTDFLADIFHPMSKETATIDSLKKSWIENTDPWSIIVEKSGLHIANSGRIPAILSLLFCLDKRAWFDAIEKLPLPQLLCDSISLVMQDCDEAILLLLIKSAPVMFDRQNQWLRHSSILLIAHEIVSQATHIHSRLLHLESKNWLPQTDVSEEAGLRRQKFETEGAIDWFKLAYSVLLSRADGKEIALFFLQRYICQCTHGFYGKAAGAWVPERTAIPVLAAELRRQGCSVEDLKQRWIREEKKAQDEGGRISAVSSMAADSESATDDAVGECAKILRTDGLPLLLAAASLWQAEHGNRASCELKNNEARLLWEWLDALLQGYDSRLSLLCKREQLITSSTILLANVLAYCLDPKEQWWQSFTALESQRHRLRYRIGSFRWPFGSSEILNTIALITWELILKKEEFKFDDSYMANFMNGLYESSWFLYLTARQGIATSRDYIKRLMIENLARFISFAPENSLDIVGKMISSVKEEPEIVAEIRNFHINIVEQNLYTIEMLNFRLNAVGLEPLKNEEFSDPIRRKAL